MHCIKKLEARATSTKIIQPPKNPNENDENKPTVHLTEKLSTILTSLNTNCKV